MIPRLRFWWPAVWAILLVAAGAVIQARLVVTSDLRLFLPSPTNANERLLLDGIGSGPAARIVLVAVEGGNREVLATASARLARELRQLREVRAVLNGDGIGGLSIPERLQPMKYLLADVALDAKALEDALAERATDLASPMAPLVESLLPADPMLVTLRLAEEWTPSRRPSSYQGVWFDQSGHRALQVIELALSGFDADSQGRSLAALHSAVDRAALPQGVSVTFTGPAAFSALMRGRTEREASWIATFDSVALVCLLFIAYRRWQWVLLGALPLASAGIAGLAAVALLFGEAHAITLAFGFTLIGVAQDYPLHLFSHLHPGTDAATQAKRLWPTLATGVASTCIAYGAFAVSGVRGLAQLACFTVTGLAVAALASRWVLPSLVGRAERDPAESTLLQALWRHVEALPRPSGLVVFLVAITLLAIRFAPTPLWESNLGALTPVPRHLLQLDAALRHDLGTADVRYLLAMDGHDEASVLARSDALMPVLAAWRKNGLITDYDLAARYLAPVAKQQQRQAALPEPSRLARDLQMAADHAGFDASAFAPFLDEVEKARHAPPLTLDDLRGTPLESRVASLLFRNGANWTALVTVAGVRDAALLARESARHGALLLDLKQAATGLMQRQRQEMLRLLGIAGLLLLVVVWRSLRSPRRVARVVAPMAVTTLVIVASLQALGISMTVFHLIALILAAGLGLDYALFFELPAADRHEQVRTFHAVLACTATTFLVFALLACSSLPVLRGIGLTVAIGVAGNFVLALLISRPQSTVPGQEATP